LTASWQLWAEKFNTLNKRERCMVFFAGLAVIYFVLNTLLVDPVGTEHGDLTNKVAQGREQLADLKQQMAIMAKTPVLDVDASNKAKMTELNRTITAQSQALLAVSDTLVSPELMPQLLERLMRRHAAIRLVHMNTLPPVNFMQSSGDAIATQAQSQVTPISPELGVYQHGLQITLSGHYMALLQYAEALQDLSKQVLWDKAELVTKDYPTSELTVTVYTLSLDKAWLTI
jgi:MSHA biogenesis protein MshJ